MLIISDTNQKVNNDNDSTNRLYNDLDKFLIEFFPDQDEPIHLRTFAPKDAPEGYSYPEKIPTTRRELKNDVRLQDKLSEINTKDGLYFVVNSGGDNDQSITRFNAFFIDIDEGTLEDQKKALDEAPIVPSIMVKVKRGFHAYWLLEGDASESEWRETQNRLNEYFDSDRSIKNPSRCMRLPFFSHITYNAHENLTLCSVEVEQFSCRRYTVREMLESFPAPAKPESAATSDTRSTPDLSTWEGLNLEARKRLLAIRPITYSSDGEWAHVKGICHSGQGNTAIAVNLATGAYMCLKDCAGEVIRQALGLPEKPIRSEDRGSAKVLSDSRIKSMAELLQKEIPEPKYAIDGLLCEGVTLLVSPPKKGKSWMAANIAFAVAFGGEALGSIPVPEGDVLYLDLESNERRLQYRARKILGNSNVAPERLYYATEWKLLADGGLKEIEEWLIQHPNARLIIIDTLKCVRTTARGRQDPYTIDYEAIAPLSKLGRDHHVSILVVHHTRKAESDDPFALVSGTYGLTGAADGVWVLMRARRDTGSILHVTSRDFEERELALKWDRKIFSWTIAGNVDDLLISKERREIIEQVALGGVMTPKEVASALKRNEVATRKLMAAMNRDGQLANDGSGHYSISINNGNSSNYSNPSNSSNSDNVINSVCTWDSNDGNSSNTLHSVKLDNRVTGVTGADSNIKIRSSFSRPHLRVPTREGKMAEIEDEPIRSNNAKHGLVNVGNDKDLENNELQERIGILEHDGKMTTEGAEFHARFKSPDEMNPMPLMLKIRLKPKVVSLADQAFPPYPTPDADVDMSDVPF